MRVLTLVILTVLAVAAPAGAATAHVEFRGDPRDSYAVVVFEAAPGERNLVTTEPAGQTVTVRDAGAAITPGGGCVAVDGGVNCEAKSVDVALGDQDDSASAEAANSQISGGAGNDRLSGSVKLVGGPGEDHLTGPGPFYDEDGATPAHDVYRGTGKTELSYGTRPTGIRVDLRAGRAAEDTVSGIPDVNGGFGDDVLIGDARPNHLSGSRGADRVVGLGGDDQLEVGSCCQEGIGGAETLEGGRGDDAIDPTGGGPATVRCGPGADKVEAITRRASLAADCETVGLDPGNARLTPVLRGAGANFVTFKRCGCATHTFRALTRDDRVVARARGRTGAVTLRLNALGRRLLERRGRLDATVTIRDGHIYESFRTVLRLRR